MDKCSWLKRQWLWASQTVTILVIVSATSLLFHTTATPESFIQSAMASIPDEVKDKAKSTHDALAAQPTVDLINIATQLGRLDIISLSLTVLGVALAIGGIFGLFNFRSMAKEAAHKAALETAEVNIKKLILSKEFKDSLRPDLEEMLDSFVDQKVDETLKAKGYGQKSTTQYDLSTPSDLDNSDIWNDESKGEV